MPKKEKSFAAKLAHEARIIHKHECDVCGKEQVPVVFYKALYSEAGNWRSQRRKLKVCNCNREEVYG